VRKNCPKISEWTYICRYVLSLPGGLWWSPSQIQAYVCIPNNLIENYNTATLHLIITILSLNTLVIFKPGSSVSDDGEMMTAPRHHGFRYYVHTYVCTYVDIVSPMQTTHINGNI
jgi:hypothetical protein